MKSIVGNYIRICNSPLHVLKLMAECPHNVIGVLSLRYADPLKYASRGSTVDAFVCVDISTMHHHTGK